MSFFNKIKAHPIIDVDTISPIHVEMDDAVEEGGEDNSIVTLLQLALVNEYQQWDLYTAYSSRLKGVARQPVAEEFKDHAKEELEHIEVIQRYLVSMGENPTLQRKSLPDMPQGSSIKDIVQFQLGFEQDAVSLYKKILSIIPENEPLKLDIENISIKEQEHVHDLELLIKEPTLAKVLADQYFRPTEPGEPTKPQAGYGQGCGCACDNCTCKSEITKTEQAWCAKALKELTPDIYARWYQGKQLTVQEKAFVLQAISLKWKLKDTRAMLRFLDFSV